MIKHRKEIGRIGRTMIIIETIKKRVNNTTVAITIINQIVAINYHKIRVGPNQIETREVDNTMTKITMIVYPSVTEGRRWVRTLTEGTRAVRVAIVKGKTKSQVWISTTSGRPTINKHTKDSITKNKRTRLKDLTSRVTKIAHQIIPLKPRQRINHTKQVNQ